MINPSLAKLIILSAPSGAGKTSLSKRLINESKTIKLAVSHTTRAPRESEVNGIDYLFVSEDEFINLIKQGAFLEHAKVFGNYYGTSINSVETLMKNGKTVLLEIDWQGARKIRQNISDSLSVFLLPPSRKALIDRLRSRGQDSELTIKGRMVEAIEQISHYHEYDHVIINDDFEKAYSELISIIEGKSIKSQLSKKQLIAFTDSLINEKLALK